MSDPPDPPPPQMQRKSRVLAALDDPNLYSMNPTTPLLGTTLPPASLGFLQRQRLTTPALGYDYSGLLGHMEGSRRKRKTPDPENDYDYGEASSSSPRSVSARGTGLKGNFGLNYDQESFLSSIDIGGDDQETRMAEFVSRGIDNAAHGLTAQKAMENLGLNDKKDFLPGMEVRLLPHQLIGVSWMVDQERASQYKGGILADDMGLGKTVQMIATMVVNQPTEDDRHHCTLIVVPAALLLQWKEELDSKTNGMFEVHIQHGKDKIKDPERLQEKDVIITTYQTLNLDVNVPNDVENGNELQWLKENGGPMSQIKWHRVVLDEAQFVRNRGTRCSKAVAMLRSKYRWCLTGTPITNTLADIYGYLRFGKFRPWNDWESFNRHIAKEQLSDARLAGLRAQEVLKPLLLRRTKDAKLENGDPILQLLPKDVELVYVEFSEDERELYEQFEKRAQIQINRFIRSNTLLKNHQQVLVLILRLRQLCTHPYLVLNDTIGLMDPTAVIGSEGDKEIARATRAMGFKWVSTIKQRFLERAKAIELSSGDSDEEQEPLCPRCEDLFLENNGRILSCGHEICADCVTDLASHEIEHNGEFGNNDEQTNLRIEKEFETAAAKGLRPCPTCKKMQDLRPNSVFTASAFMPTQDEVRAACRAPKRPQISPPEKKRKIDVVDISDTSSSGSDSDDSMPDVSALLRSSPSDKNAKKSSGGKKLVKGKASGRGKKQADSDSDMDSDSESAPKKTKGKLSGPKAKAKNEDRDSSEPPTLNPNQFEAWKHGGSNVEASAKMLKMVEYLKEWEASGDKTIVFSQWTSMLDLCEQVFARHGIRSLRYDGGMGREAREFCLAQFRRPGGPRVILVSIKCGGVGLNLVTANRVINLDLSWNYASESQAYDRVHRLGQEKSVFVKRLVIHNTIEERMLTLQETKLGLAEAALGEGTGTRLQKLSVKQIKTLFGMTSLSNKDKDGSQSQPRQSQ